MNIELLLFGIPKTPNALNKLHWSKRYKENKKWKEATQWAVIDQKKTCGNSLILPFPKAHISITRFSTRKCDYDNGIASMKPIIDGLKEAKVIIDDNYDILKSISFKWQRCKFKDERIHIIVEPVC